MLKRITSPEDPAILGIICRRYTHHDESYSNISRRTSSIVEYICDEPRSLAVLVYLGSSEERFDSASFLSIHKKQMRTGRRHIWITEGDVYQRAVHPP